MSSFTAKETANAKLAEVKAAYKEATLVWQLMANAETWEAKEKLKKQLDRAKADARKYWSPGDPPII